MCVSVQQLNRAQEIFRIRMDMAENRQLLLMQL